MSDCTTPSNKVLCEALRHDPTGFHIVELETSLSASEAEWLAAYRADGWNTLNVAGANRKAPKKRDTVKEREWRDANARAEVRLADGKGHEVLARVSKAAAWDRYAAAHPGYIAELKAAMSRKG